MKISEIYKKTGNGSFAKKLLSFEIFPPKKDSELNKRMVTLCGASFPERFQKIIHKYEDNKAALFDAGMAFAISYKILVMLLRFSLKMKKKASSFAFSISMERILFLCPLSSLISAV